MSTINQSNKPVVLIDARGPRYSAAITSVVLALALITESSYVIGFQFAVFLSAVLFGLRRSIYGFIYRNLIQPRLSGRCPVRISGRQDLRSLLAHSLHLWLYWAVFQEIAQYF